MSLNKNENKNETEFKFLVTGGLGFIGSHLVESLYKLYPNSEITIFDISKNKQNLSKDLLESNRVNIIHGSITDYHICLKVTKNKDYVFHQAAFVSVPNSVKNPLDCFDINVSGFINIIEASRRNGVKKLIYASTSAVYNSTGGWLGNKESHNPKPSSPYGLSKLNNEMISKMYYSLYGFQSIGLRYFNVYGDKQDPSHPYAAVIPKFITQYLDNKIPTIFGDGLQTRDFIHVSDIVRANIHGINYNDNECLVVNICTGKKTSVIRINEIICKNLGINVDVNYEDERPGDVKHSFGDINKMKNIFKFHIKTNLEDGIKKTISYYKNL